MILTFNWGSLYHLCQGVFAKMQPYLERYLRANFRPSPVVEALDGWIQRLCWRWSWATLGLSVAHIHGKNTRPDQAKHRPARVTPEEECCFWDQVEGNMVSFVRVSFLQQNKLRQYKNGAEIDDPFFIFHRATQQFPTLHKWWKWPSLDATTHISTWVYRYLHMHVIERRLLLTLSRTSAGSWSTWRWCFPMHACTHVIC